MPRLTSRVPSPLEGEGQDGGCADGEQWRAVGAIPAALLIALLVSPAVAGDSFLDRTAPLQEAVPYGMALEPADAATPAPTPAAAATPAPGD